MRLKFLTALAAIPFATAAQSANIYLACFYQDDMGKLPITQLFTLKGDAIGDSYPTWGYDGIAEWEAQFATQPDQVRETSSYTEKNIIGQFSKFAEANGDSHSVCWVTTKKDHAFAWFAKESAKGRLDVGRIKDWRPIKAGVLGVQDWSGNPVEIGVCDAGARSRWRSGSVALAFGHRGGRYRRSPRPAKEEQRSSGRRVCGRNGGI